MAFEKKFYPNSGALFSVKDKKNDKAPDLTGNISLGPDTVDYIIDQVNAGNTEITLEMSGWKKVSQGGNKFLSTTVRKPFKSGPAPAARTARPIEDDEIPF